MLLWHLLNPFWPETAWSFLFYLFIYFLQKVTKPEDRLIGKVGSLLVITGHGELLFDILLHHSGPLADVDAVQELPDVLLSDRGGLLD